MVQEKSWGALHLPQPTLADIVNIHGNNVNLLPACKVHDTCYSKANQQGSNRLKCDVELKRNIINECNKMKNISSKSCFQLGQRYYLGVRFGGSSAWRNAGGKAPWSTEE